MQVSGYRHSMPQTPSNRRPPTPMGDFAQVLQSTNTVSSLSTRDISPGSSAQKAERPDFTRMTPRQFSDTAQSMYDRGEIDLDHLFKMQFAAGGIFKDTPVSSTESASTVNYVEYFRQQLSAGSPYTDHYSRNKIEEVLNLIS